MKKPGLLVSAAASLCLSFGLAAQAADTVVKEPGFAQKIDRALSKACPQSARENTQSNLYYCVRTAMGLTVGLTRAFAIWNINHETKDMLLQSSLATRMLQIGCADPLNNLAKNDSGNLADMIQPLLGGIDDCLNTIRSSEQGLNVQYEPEALEFLSNFTHCLQGLECKAPPYTSPMFA